MQLDTFQDRKIDGEIMQLNILSKFTKSFPCSVCSFAVGEAKHKICGACGEVVHVSCLKNKPPVGYWFCADCAPKFAHGHQDSALDIPLHNLIRGSSDVYRNCDLEGR
jgi:hypothetical protein